MANNNQKQEISRRKALQILGGSAAPATVAGCLGDDEDETEPEQETTDTQETTPEEEETAPEEQDQLEEPPYEEVLEPGYVDEHKDLIGDFEAFSLKLRSRIDGFDGLKYDGVVKTDNYGERFLAEFDISPMGEPRNSPDVTLGIYSDEDSGYLMLDEDSGSTEFFNLDEESASEFSLREESVINIDVLRGLGVSLDMFPELQDLESFIDESNPIYRDTRSTEYEDSSLNHLSHIYEIDNYGIVEGELAEELEGAEIRWLQLGLNQQEGVISNFDLSYIHGDQDLDNRYTGVIYDINEEKEMRPSWVVEAEVALD